MILEAYLDVHEFSMTINILQQYKPPFIRSKKFLISFTLNLIIMNLTMFKSIPEEILDNLPNI